MTDSSTGGYLVPTGSAPAEDDALDDVLQAAVVGITGLAGALVRPRFQTPVPNLPTAGTNWAAIGIADETADTFSFTQYQPATNDIISLRNEEITVLASFYGPNAGSYASLLRDGLGLAQNREALTVQGLYLVAVGSRTRAPELVQTIWWNRYDLPFVVRREVARTYSVLNLLSADGTVTTEAIVDDFET